MQDDDSVNDLISGESFDINEAFELVMPEFIERLK